MSQVRFRQVARLERLARLYIKRKQEYRTERLEVVRKELFVQVANLSFLILYGDPKIDEPLSKAWQRCLESEAWNASLEKHPAIGEYGYYQQHINPFHDLGATFLARYLRKYIIPDLPGADETEKLNAIVEKAPPWLIWFTHADVYLRNLGLKVPDLSSVNRLVRGKLTLRQLPEGPFECRLLPDGMEDEFYTSKGKDFTDTGETTKMTPRERRRALRILRKR